jgi:hypothetical protein
MRKKTIIILAIVLIACIVLVTVVLKVMSTLNKEEPVKIINKIDEYGYVLEDDETGIHKKYFDDLKTVLQSDNIDEEEYAKVVVKLFISDFYNLDNKITKNDIGGLQYILTSAKDNMVLKAKDTMYKYIESNIDGKRNQVLPIVAKVEIISVVKTEFKYNDATDKDAYKVTVKWTYKSDLGYQDEAIITLVYEGKKLNIAGIVKE